MTIKAVDTDVTISRWKWSFADAFANTVDPSFADVVMAGAGMTINQTGGNLVIGAGVNAYAESIIRVKEPVVLDGILRYGLTLSQRIVNNNFAIELVDYPLGLTPLAMTVNSTTAVSIFKQEHGLTSKDIGKSLWIAGISLANCPAMYATIASITDTDNFVLTVAGFPASGTGTCYLFGMNHHQVVYNGATATVLGGGYTTARKGYRNTPSSATINTTAAPGHVGILESVRHSDAGFLDGAQSVLTSGLKFTTRAAVDQNIPDIQQLYLQIRVFNGSVAPVSNTTLTLSVIDMEVFNVQAVQIAGIDNFAKRAAIPVDMASAFGSTSSMVVVGGAAHSAVSSGNPVRIGGRVNTAADITLIAGDASDLFMTSAGQLVNKPFGTAELDWQYASIAGGIVNTTDVAVKAAAGASVRNYVTGIQYRNTNAVATELVIKDGSTVIWRVLAPANMAAPEDCVFITPLKGTANTAINVACITTGAAVYVNLQGYSSF